MILRVFVSLIVIVAVVVGLLNITPFHTDVIRLAMFGEFFSAALPILAFGGLIKYLCTCSGVSCSCCKGTGCNCCGAKKACPPGAS